MLGNLLLAGAMSFVQPHYAEAFYTHPHVKQVLCTYVRGTAWRISPGRFASVHHVVENDGCTILGQPITVEHDDPIHDFSIVTIPNDPETGGIPVNCGGFNDGVWYYSVGYARGWPVSVTISIKAGGPFTLGTLMRGWSIFKGIEFVIPGMSGGPVLDAFGKAVGEVNAYNDEEGLSWSRPLRETILCEGVPMI